MQPSNLQRGWWVRGCAIFPFWGMPTDPTEKHTFACRLLGMWNSHVSHAPVTLNIRREKAKSWVMLKTNPQNIYTISIIRDIHIIIYLSRRWVKFFVGCVAPVVSSACRRRWLQAGTDFFGARGNPWWMNHIPLHDSIYIWYIYLWYLMIIYDCLILYMYGTCK